MKLYEIDHEIGELLDRLATETDPETGEVSDNFPEIIEAISALQEERDRKLVGITKHILNVRSDVAMLKAEEERLHKRRSALESQAKRLEDFLADQCKGEKTDFGGIATMSFRQNKATEVTDKNACLKWLEDHGHLECIKYTDPEVRKDVVKKLLADNDVPGVEIVINVTHNLK